MEIEDFRREYLQAGLRREQLCDDPMAQFEIWLQQAVASGITDPTAMVLATVEAGARPWQRIVLLKDFGPQGFVFYTNRESRKAVAMAANAQVSLLFPWNLLERQVMVGGAVEQMPAEEVSPYFNSRPRASQLAAWASAQSRPLAARAVLEQRVAELEEQFSGAEIPMPDCWGGYRVVPQQIEFWQGGAHRLHDRFLYSRQGARQWTIERLSP